MEQFLKIREYLAAYITFAMLTLDLFLNTMDVTPKRKRLELHLTYTIMSSKGSNS